MVFIAFLLGVMFVLLGYSFSRLHRRRAYPPGSPGWPLLGSITHLPKMPTWSTYREWGRIYGSKIIYLQVLGHSRLVIDGLETANELLDKRSAIYSDRPPMPMFNDLCGFKWTIGTTRYGTIWREKRKMLRNHFNAQASKSHRNIERKATLAFLGNLLRTPEQFMDHVRLMTGAQVLEITYGIEVTDSQNPYLRISEHAMECASACTNAGVYLVDIFPFLRHVPAWLPGAGFKRQARFWRQAGQDAADVPFEAYKNFKDNAPDCVAASLLPPRSADYTGIDGIFTERHIKEALGTVFLAGSETTISTVNTFFLAMTLYPEVQSKAQAEIDKLCNGCLPTFDDRARLPFVQAIVMETLRWNPVTPEALPHATTKDDIYEGFFIPKGTVVIPNVWAILRDEENYVEPDLFNPDRFLKDGKLDPDVLDPSMVAFGFGRRICPGRFMALDSIWITVASVLAVFDIRKALDAEGKVLTPTGEYRETFFRHPEPFACDIRIRNEKYRQIILGNE